MRIAKQHFPIFLAIGFAALNTSTQANSIEQGPVVPPVISPPPNELPGEAEPPPPAQQPAVRHIKGGIYEVGNITLDRKTREIHIPAVVNMTEGEIEFPLTHEQGRLHEAIFATSAIPFHLEIALRLLRYEPSKEVFPTWPDVDMDDPPPWDEWPEPTYAETNPLSHLTIYAQWEQNGETIERSLTEMVIQPIQPEMRRLDSMADYWVFTGSQERMTEQIPELGGALVGIRPEFACSINTLGKEEIHKIPWFAITENIPAMGSNVTIIIRPAPQNVIDTPNPMNNSEKSSP